jgi:hypothetical protein
MKIKCVLHKSYGGFHLTTEIVEEMDRLGFDWKTIGITDKPVSETLGDSIYEGNTDEFSFRSNPIFVQAVENIQQKYADLDWMANRKNYIFNLKIVEFTPSFHIEDYNDGHEKLMCNGREIYD